MMLDGMFSPLCLFAFGLFGMLCGIFAGINTGIGWSEIMGPQAACEAYRLSVFDCAKLAPKEQQP